MTAPDDEASRDDLEREAERVRARLLTTLDVLDRRRHDLMDVRRQVTEHAVPVISAGLAITLAIGGAVGFAIYRAIDRRHHRGRERMRALVQLWRHPEAATRPAERSVFGEVARRVAIAVGSMIAVELAKRAVRKAPILAASGDTRVSDSGARPIPRVGTVVALPTAVNGGARG